MLLFDKLKTIHSVKTVSILLKTYLASVALTNDSRSLFQPFHIPRSFMCKLITPTIVVQSRMQLLVWVRLSLSLCTPDSTRKQLPTHMLHILHCYWMQADTYIPVSVGMSLCSQPLVQGIPSQHTWRCQMLAKGHGGRQMGSWLFAIAAHTKGVNSTRQLQVSGTWHLPDCTFECEAGHPWFVTERPEK